MNLYFWFFAVYAFLITPVRLRLDFRLEKAAYYRLRVQVAGVELLRRRTSNETEVAVPSKPPDVMLWLGVFRQGVIRPLLRSLHLQSLALKARISFEDAGLNALAFAFARTVLETLVCCGVSSGRLAGRVEMDFQARGTEVAVSGIFVSRLGNIGIAAARFGLAVLRTRARLSMAEEEKYAASH